MCYLASAVFCSFVKIKLKVPLYHIKKFLAETKWVKFPTSGVRTGSLVHLFITYGFSPVWGPPIVGENQIIGKVTTKAKLRVGH